MITTRIRDFAAMPLRWEQPRSLRMEYELRASGQTLATLHFRSAFGTFATLQDGEGSWTFKRMGFWRTHVSIRALASDEELGAFQNNTWKQGGTLVLSDGRAYLASTNFWSTQYSFCTPQEEPLIHFAKFRGILHASTEVTVLPAARQLPELPWMIGLGWYLTLMMHRDTVAVTTATTAS